MNTITRTLALLPPALLALNFSACSQRRAATLPAVEKPMKTVRAGYSEKGFASWYGPNYNGKHTSNGEIYDMNQLTAAHRRLPFNSVARVENTANKKTVDVRINDRGPFVAGRIIDLSKEAATRINMIGAGTTKVKLKVIKGSTSDLGSAPYSIAQQLAPSTSPANKIYDGLTSSAR